MTGSPAGISSWLVTLCALAGLAALLKGSEGSVRQRLVRLGAALLAVSALTYALAASGGDSCTVRTYPDGHSVVLISESGAGVGAATGVPWRPVAGSPRPGPVCWRSPRSG